MMGTELFVTCGRGLNTFAIKEIKEKIANVTGIKALGEGKLAFTIRCMKLFESDECRLTGRNVICVGSVGTGNQQGATDIGNKTVEEHPSPDNCSKGRTRCVTTKEEDLLYVSAVAPVFQLKLVERIFLLLHCEEAENQYGSSGKLPNPYDFSTHSAALRPYEEKLTGVVKKINWGEVSYIVRLLRDYHASTTNPRIICQDRATCPGLTTEPSVFQQQQKRKLTCSTHSKSKRVILDNSLHQPGPSCEQVENMRLADENDTAIENGVYGSALPIMTEEYRENKNHHISVAAKKPVPERPCTKKKSCEKVTNSNKEQENVLPQRSNELSQNEGQQGHVYLKAEEENLAHKHSEEKDSEKKSFRVSCRISGFYRTVLTKHWLNQTVIQNVKSVTSWSLNWREPLIDLYVNITDSHFIVGVTLTPRPLSLRVYAPHLPLRSTLAYLVAYLAHISPGSTVLDPMCGGGTILLEAATNFDVGLVIASDVNPKQLQVAKCNLRTLYSPVSFLQASAIALPLHSCSVDVVLCDFPFGLKHKVKEDDSDLLRRVLKEISRLLVCGGCAVFLISPRQHYILTHITDTGDITSSLHSQGLPLQHKDSHLVSMGETSAYVTILMREERSP